MELSVLHEMIHHIHTYVMGEFFLMFTPLYTEEMVWMFPLKTPMEMMKNIIKFSVFPVKVFVS